jgi:hypothetical protein
VGLEYRLIWGLKNFSYSIVRYDNNSNNNYDNNPYFRAVSKMKFPFKLIGLDSHVNTVTTIKPHASM